jgi:hypothetical protein
MPNGRTLAVAGLTGALVALLIAVLVLGRSEPAEGLTLADIDHGGVLVSRTEIYQRHGAKAEQLATLVSGGDIGLYPEQRVDETRALYDPDGAVEAFGSVSWTADGQLFQRVRVTDDGVLITERPEFGVRDARELGHSVVGEGAFASAPRPSELFEQARAEFEEAVASGGWTEVTAPAGFRKWESRQRINPGDLLAPASSGYSVPYYGDLDAVEMVRQVTYVEGDGLSTDESFVILADGSRILVESRRSTLEALPASSWDTFVAEVWGSD